MPRLAVVLHLFAAIVVVFAAAMLVPLGVSLVAEDGAAPAFEWACALTALVGGGVWFATRRAKGELQIRDGFLFAVLAWTALPALATLPLTAYFRGLSFTDAYFEAMSGITTTGATMFTGLDRFPPSILIWRHLLVWMGGMGIIVLTVAILPLLGVGGSQLYKAETPGPMKDAKLTPRITETAKGLWLVYVVLTAACAVAFRIAGMSWFDAVAHGFSTLGLGAFSTHDASFAYFNSVPIETVAVAFMLIAGMNFGTHFLAWRGLTLAPYRNDPEVPLFVGLTALSVFGIAAFLYVNHAYPDYTTALRFAAFNVVSIATTTGYSNTNYGLWPVFAPLWMLFLGSFATCAGSPGGGIKMIRAQILFKQSLRELLRGIHPKLYRPVKLAGQSIENNIVFSVLAYAFVYLCCISLLTLVLTASGIDALSAFSAVVACINNTGPGLNAVGPAATYQSLTDLQTWVLTFAMLLGRLELFTLLVVLTPAFWRR